MKLQSVVAERFRSVKNLRLPNIGELNVFIGKNNSGKSTLLLAIEVFFKCIKEGDLVNLRPPVGREIDFFQRIVKQPLEIELSFSISQDERELLLHEIIEEAAQMRNAVESWPEQLTLSARVSILRRPRAAYVSKIFLTSNGNSKSVAVDLLKVSEAAADELIRKYSRAAEIRGELTGYENVLSRIDSDDWARAKSVKERGASRYMLRLPSELLSSSKFEALFDESPSFPEFRESIKSHIEDLRIRAEKTINEPLKHLLTTFSGQEKAAPKYIQKLLLRISALKVLYLQERREPIGEDEAQKLLTLKTERGGTAVLNRIQATVNSLLGVKIDAFKSSSANEKAPAEIDVDDFLAEVNGSGVREALRMILDFEFKRPDIFLVEEPEIYLHPALETGMMRYLKEISRHAQVFITTHSTNFLDTAEMKNVYLVSKQDSTSVQRLNLEDAEAQIPQELGIRLSSLFLFDRLVFVEGPSDEVIIREWAAKANINFSQAGVGFVHMGGVHNFSYFAAEQTLTFLAKRKVRVWFVLDKDEKEVEDIASLAKRCGANAKLKVLERRELENYLLIPKILIEFIQQKRSLANEVLLPEDQLNEPLIAKAIDSACESLKQHAIEKRIVKKLGRPLHPLPRSLFDGVESVGKEKLGKSIAEAMEVLARTKSQLDEVMLEVTQEIEARWAAEKTSIVPGDKVLDQVCKSFGVRFKKEIDGSRVASLFSADELPDEILRLIREIGSI
jgi:putative ATP-dependent endonuclease of OLD family